MKGSRWDEQAVAAIQRKAETGKPDLASAHAHSSLNGIMLLPAGLYGVPSYGEASIEVHIGAETSSSPISAEMPLFLSSPAKGLNQPLLEASSTLVTFCMVDGGIQGSDYLGIERSIVRWGPDREAVDLDSLRAAGGVMVQAFDPSSALRGAPSRFLGFGKDMDLLKAIDLMKEITLHQSPVFLELPGNEPENEIIDAINAGADAVVFTDRGVDLQGAYGPTLHALIAAKEIKSKVEDIETKVLAVGDYRSSIDVVKALALGADAVNMVDAVLRAAGIPGHQGPQPQLDPDAISKRVANFLGATAQEIRMILDLMGKSSIAELSPDDLVALDYDTAAITGLPLSGHGKKLAMWMH